MTQHCVIIQEGFGVNGEAVYYTDEPPVYETRRVPVIARLVEGDEVRAVHVDEREETFVHFTPVNGPSRRRGKLNCIPFTRLIAVIEASDYTGQHTPHSKNDVLDQLRREQA